MLFRKLSALVPLIITLLAALPAGAATPVLVTSATMGGWIDPVGKPPIPDGSDPVTVTVTADTVNRYHIAKVVVDGIVIIPIASPWFTTIQPDGRTHKVSAVFARNPAVTATAGKGGEITPRGKTIMPLDGVPVTVTAFTGYHIASVTVDGETETAPQAPWSRLIPYDGKRHKVSAKFALNDYPVTLTYPNGHGKVTPLRQTVRHSAKNVKFSVIPDAGYKIVEVKLNGISYGAVKSLTVQQVTGPLTISADFRPLSWVPPVPATFSGSVLRSSPCSGATVTLYELSDTGVRGSVLGSGVTGSDGSFSIDLEDTPTTNLELVAAEGSYTSSYTGASVAATFPVSVLLRHPPAGGLQGMNVTPLTRIEGERARYLVAKGGAYADAVVQARSETALRYGLDGTAPPMYVTPRFDPATFADDPQGAISARVLRSLDAVSNRLRPQDPDAAIEALALDFSDGTFNGRKDLLNITIGGDTIPPTTGTTEFLHCTVLDATATAEGVYPGFVAALYEAGTIDETYTSTIIPVYVADTIAAYTPTWNALIPQADPPQSPASAYGYSCSNGAKLILESPPDNFRCSDGSIAIYTADSVVPYTADPLVPFLAAPVRVGNPASGTIPVYTSTTDIHVFTEAERGAMNASSMAGYGTGGHTQQGPLNSSQIEWYGKLNQTIQAAFGY